MARTIDEELQAHDSHAQWLAWYYHKPEGPQPPPGYKDCRNCRLRWEYDTDEERGEFCATQCPWDDLPASPSRRFLTLSIWASLPDSVLAHHATGMGLNMLLDIQKLKQYREDRRRGIFG